MASLNRRKVNLEDDPLSFLGGGPADDEEDEEPVRRPAAVAPPPTAPVVQPVLKAVDPQPKAPEPVAKSTKSNLFGDDDDFLIAPLKVAPPKVQPAPVVQPVPEPAPVVQPVPIVEPVPVVQPVPVVEPAKPVEQKSEIVDSVEDVFTFTPSSTVSTSATQKASGKPTVSANAAMSKIADGKDEEDVSDLKVSNLLEKEDQLDYHLFGRADTTEVHRRRIEQKIHDLDQEDAFLRELDDMTSRKIVQPAPVTSTVAAAAAPPKPVATSTPAADFDLMSLDLNAYIDQESSSGGGLFD